MFKISITRPGVTLLLLTILFSINPAHATDDETKANQSRHYSVDEIARKIDQQPKWRVLAAEPTTENRKTLYRFKILEKEKGRVKVITIDPDNPQLNQFE